jgi:16S rRNA processing protein RimM
LNGRPIGRPFVYDEMTRTEDFGDMNSKQMLLMARIGGAHGIKGEVRAQAFTGDPSAVGDYGPLTAADGRTFEILKAKPSKNIVLLTIKGVSDRNAAEALNGLELFIDRDTLPDDALDDGEVYQDDLIGLAVKDAEGTAHGSIIAVHDFGAGIVLEIKPDRGPSVMIPFSEAAVPELDVDAGWLLVEPIAAGLVDDGEDSPGEEEAASRPNPGSRRRRPPKDTGAD